MTVEPFSHRSIEQGVVTGRAVPDTTSRNHLGLGHGLGWVVAWPGLRTDQMCTEFPFEEVEEGFDLGGWFRRPQVTVRRTQHRDVLLVNDFQRWRTCDVCPITILNLTP
jgi:hypothetical protein